MVQGKNLHPKVSFPNLDGLRFFCFLSVFLYHSFATNYISVSKTKLYLFLKGFIAHNGNLGVNFFFVLSGFLITYLLLTEKENFGSINVGKFYIRRILRIWPLFYLCVLFGFYIFPIIKSRMGGVPAETADISYYLVFLNNFDFIKKGIPDSSVLGVLWSVAIEEQFYLLWPLILYIFPAKLYKYIFCIIILLSFLFRLVHADNGIVLELHTISCISDMTVGGLFAVLIFQYKELEERIRNIPKYAWIILYLIVATVFLFRHKLFDGNYFLLASDRLIISLLFGLIILEQNFALNSIFKMSNYKYITKLGTYTYGLYCLHMIGILIAAKILAKLGLNKNVYEVVFLEGTLSLVLAIIIATLSYKFYESRFLLLKEKFARVSRY
jgi:peptidoglycan/LPS O-acetylase OafA/YrhL